MTTVCHQPYWLVFGGNALAGEEPQHVFCGPSGHACPSCAGPLTRYAVLDRADERLALSVEGPLPLEFCWRCGLSQGAFHYRVGDGGELEATRFERGPVEDDFPYADYPDHFAAAPLRLEPVAPDDARVLGYVREGVIDPTEVWRTHPALVDPRHHIGPEPLFGPEPDPPSCTTCGVPMEFFAAFGDATTDPRGFVGEAGVQVRFHVCGRCEEVAVLQLSD